MIYEDLGFSSAEGPRSRRYGRTAALRLLVQPYDEDKDDYFCPFPSCGAPVEWKVTGKSLSLCHFVHHKSHMDTPGIEPGPPRWKAGG
jgi:hypothetical protein